MKINEISGRSVSSSLFGFIAFLTAVYVFVLLQIAAEGDYLFGFSNWLITDSITNYQTVTGLVKGDSKLSDFLGSAAVPLYYSLFWNLGILGFLAANIFLLIIGVRFYGLRAVYFSLLLYPHYLQLLVLP